MSTKWKTHPWITFAISLEKLNPSTWIKFGEARSKCDHLSGVPLTPKVSKTLHLIFLAKGVHATTAIEGNTLTEQEVLEIIQKADHTPKSQEYLKTEVKNVACAANKILDDVETYGYRKITTKNIKDYNKTVLNGLKVEPYVVPGEISKVQVGVGGGGIPAYRGLPPDQCDDALNELANWLNSSAFNTEDDELTIIYGLIKAIVSHIYLVWIHPFGDGNGRTARLLEVRFLLEAGIPSAAGHLLSNHYNKTRSEYYRQLANASRNGGNLCDFVEYAISGFIDQIREQLLAVKRHQWDMTWINFIHDQFYDTSSSSKKRQRKLAIALSQESEIVPRKSIRRITPEMAEEYAGLHDKTITRDLNDLAILELIEKVGDGYRAKKETVLQFLPRGRQGNREAQLAQAQLIREGTSSQLSLEL